VTWSKTPALDLRSSNSGTESPISRAPTPRLLATIFTSRSGCEKGSERNKTAFTMLKIAVFAPTPKARESTATIAKPGLSQSTRSPYRISCNSVVIQPPLERLISNANSKRPQREEACRGVRVIPCPPPQDVRVSSYFDHGGTTPLERA